MIKHLILAVCVNAMVLLPLFNNIYVLLESFAHRFISTFPFIAYYIHIVYEFIAQHIRTMNPDYWQVCVCVVYSVF
jgi:hypothetical protein